MHPIIESFLIACAASLFANLSGVIKQLKWWLMIRGYWYKVAEFNPGGRTTRSLKPFDCELCMGFWLGIVYFFMFHPVSIPLNIGLAALSSVLSIWITKFTNNLSSTSKF